MTPLEALKRYFGYRQFRPHQLEIIQTLLAGRDVMAFMPTGGGKSLCFQIPGLVTGGLTLVISPLIALMTDQVEQLKRKGIPAAALHANLDPDAQRQILEALQSNALRILYVSPERLFSQDFFYRLQYLDIRFLAVDEAHCVSFWGHDFRPEYAQLGILKQLFPDRPIIALTASADPLTQQDLITGLGLQNPAVFIASLDRPNLRIAVQTPNNRMTALIKFIRTRPPDASGIVYCLSRSETETVASKLKKIGFNAAAYHAGLTSNVRDDVQNAFMRDKIRIICATIAFGMGVDKSNIRWIIHHNIPKNLESYYQEIGRAGRDGQLADVILYYLPSDVDRQYRFFEELNEDRRKIMTERLHAMVNYAESSLCRRQILLSYFGQPPLTACGTCDNCLYPCRKIDGTILAQKVLSAVYRSQQQLQSHEVIELLMGVRSDILVQQGWDKLKTFGVGKDVPPKAWKHYIRQIIALGGLRVGYEDNFKLKLTELSHRILFEGHKVTFESVVKQPRTNQTKPQH